MSVRGQKPRRKGPPAELLEMLHSLALNIDYLNSERDRLVRVALDAGHSQRAVSKAAGWSPTAVHMRLKYERGSGL